VEKSKAVQPAQLLLVKQYLYIGDALFELVLSWAKVRQQFSFQVDFQDVAAGRSAVEERVVGVHLQHAQTSFEPWVEF